MECLKNEVNVNSDRLINVEREMKNMEEIHEIQLKQLEITRKQIEKLNTKKVNITCILENLNSELKKMKELIDKTVVIEKIIIDECEEMYYNMLNGLVDLNRDIIMKLLKLKGDKTKTKSVCHTFYSSSFFFFPHRSLE
ncbi:hypothetical protein FACS189472_17450 [Alphaproteobacteria bacterium]|nr:hypothetical protein FACS189472_17450 [Alphaproteobacteria bacterium]